MTPERERELLDLICAFNKLRWPWGEPHVHTFKDGRRTVWHLVQGCSHFAEGAAWAESEECLHAVAGEALLCCESVHLDDVPMSGDCYRSWMQPASPNLISELRRDPVRVVALLRAFNATFGAALS